MKWKPHYTGIEILETRWLYLQRWQRSKLITLIRIQTPWVCFGLLWHESWWTCFLFGYRRFPIGHHSFKICRSLRYKRNLS